MKTGKTTDGVPLELQIDPASKAQNIMVINGVSLIDVTLSLDTGAYADGDVLADTQEVADALRLEGGSGVIQSVTILDRDDNGTAIDIVFLSKDVSLGTENGAISISDADAINILGIVQVFAGDYVDLANSQFVTKTNLSIVAKNSEGLSTKSIYVGVISRATSTYTAAGITLRIGILRD